MTDTPYDFQVVIDCSAPHDLADWWAAALGWSVEPSDEAFITKMVDAGHASSDDTTRHNGVLVWKEGAAIRRPEESGELGDRRILFQLVPEAKTAKNRVHLDLRVGPEKVETEVERLVGSGATVLHRGQQGPMHTWVTIADPEGNELCIS